MNKRSWIWELLVYVAVIACFSIAFPIWGFRYFDDEAETLAAGRLLASGYTLYRDVFAHHFPFPYYFVSLFFHLTGPSIPLIRLCLTLFAALSFFTASQLTGQRKTMLAAFIVWICVGPLYLSHMMLYHSFVAASITVVFSVSLWLAFEERAVEAPKIGVLLGIFSVITFLSDPLTLYPLGVAFLFCLRRSYRLIALWWIGTGILLMILWMMRLLFTGSLDEFWDQAIRFNLETYATYRSNTFILSSLWDQIQSSLHLFDSQWWGEPILPKGFFEADFWESLDRSLIGGYAYRMIILTACAWSIVRMRFRLALFLASFFALLLASGHDKTIQGQSFVALTICTCCFLVSYSRWLRVPIFAYLSALTIVSLMWLDTKRAELSYQKSFGQFEERASYFYDIVPKASRVRFGVYPADPYLYFLRPFRPIAGFTFMWPWVADYGREKLIKSLGREPALIQVNTHGDIWGIPHIRSLGPVLDYCKANCFLLKHQIFMTQQLVASKAFEKLFLARPKTRNISLGFPDRYVGPLFLKPVEPEVESIQDVAIGDLRWPAFRLKEGSQNTAMHFFSRGADLLHLAICARHSVEVRISNRTVLVPDEHQEEIECTIESVPLAGIRSVAIEAVDKGRAGDVIVAGAHMAGVPSMFDDPFSYIRAMNDSVKTMQ